MGKKIKNKNTAKKNHSDSDAMLLTATFLFLQLCDCAIVLSDYIVRILYQRASFAKPGAR